MMIEIFYPIYESLTKQQLVAAFASFTLFGCMMSVAKPLWVYYKSTSKVIAVPVVIGFACFSIQTYMSMHTASEYSRVIKKTEFSPAALPSTVNADNVVISGVQVNSFESCLTDNIKRIRKSVSILWEQAYHNTGRMNNWRLAEYPSNKDSKGNIVPAYWRIPDGGLYSRITGTPDGGSGSGSKAAGR